MKLNDLADHGGVFLCSKWRILSEYLYTYTSIVGHTDAEFTRSQYMNAEFEQTRRDMQKVSDFNKKLVQQSDANFPNQNACYHKEKSRSEDLQKSGSGSRT